MELEFNLALHDGGGKRRHITIPDLVVQSYRLKAHQKMKAIVKNDQLILNLISK